MWLNLCAWCHWPIDVQFDGWQVWKWRFIVSSGNICHRCYLREMKKVAK